jgi:hypothetical protein
MYFAPHKPSTNRVFKTLRNIAISTVVLLLLFNTVGSIILLKVQERAIEESFEHALKTGQIQSNRIVKYTAADIANAQWENDHEIKLNGKYYDLVSTKNAEGITTYEFIADDEESTLFAEYNLLQKHGKAKSSLVFPFLVFYYQPNTTNSFLNKVIQTIATGSEAMHEQSRQLPLSPPPKA